MNQRLRGIRGVSPCRHAQTHQLVKRIEELGYTVTTDSHGEQTTCVASNPDAVRTLVSSGDNTYSAVRNLAIVLGLVRDARQEQTDYVLRSSTR
jgi:hypothetical protein